MFDEGEAGTADDRNPIRVLHVDDDPEFAALLREFLDREAEAFDVLTVASAEGAMEHLPDGIDCVVSDYEMPGTDGIAFLERVREEYPDLPFILFTGKGSEAVASEAIRAGVTDYLQKRVGSEQYELLGHRIAEAVGRTRSQVSYREVFEKADIGLTIRDVETRELVDVNRRYCELLGYDYDEILELGLQDLTADVDGYTSDRAREELRRCVEGESATFEWPDETADGEVLWVEIGARMAEIEGRDRILVSVRDITARKERDRAVRAEHERFLTLFENLPTPVVYGVTDDERDLRIRAVNPAFEETFGLSPGAAQGEALYDHVLPDGEEPPVELVERTLEAGRLTTEVRRQTVDGMRDFRLDVALREPAEGPVEGYAVYSDVTEQKERERKLERTNEQLEEFASVVGHDLTTPLATASGQLELAAADADSDHLAAAQETLDRMERIVDDTLALAREGRAVGETEPVDLAALARRCWADTDHGNASLSVADAPIVEADRDRLWQLLQNLLSNAVEHGGPGVTVTLRGLDGGFSLADDGPGIPPDRRDEVLEPGVSGDSDGTGFGLAIVRRIAEAHGWSVAVAESEAGGARFELRGVDPV
jgi:PAS domain S-box-containing protein